MTSEPRLTGRNLIQPDPRPRVGVDRCLPASDDRPDLFECDDRLEWSFPCSACKHRRRPERECRDCRHCER